MNVLQAAHEEQLGLMAKTSPHILSQEQRDLAAVQHECRTMRNAPTACAQLSHSARSACHECLLRAGLEHLEKT